MSSISFHPWTDAQTEARAIRTAVFVLEQGIPESEEWDEMDASALHALARVDGRAVGTVRLLPEGKIGRMAVLAEHRGRGLGRLLLQAAVNLAAERGLREISLSAQSYLIEWYRSEGFVPEGHEHAEVGIPHQWMRMSLNQPQKNFR